MASRGGFPSCSTRGAPKDALEGRLVVHETRNVADKGGCMSYCVCVVSIVRTSYADVKEECLDKIKYVSAPAYRHKLKMANPQVWKQTQSKECSVHWHRHNPDDQDAFGLSLRPRSGRMQWADTKHDEAARNQRATSLSDKELHWNLANKPRIKLEVYAVGTPSKPEERFLGQAYLGWHEICARLRVDESRQGAPISSKIYLQVKPRSFKSRVKGYFVVSLEPRRAPSPLPLVRAPGAVGRDETVASDPNQGGRETKKRAGTPPTAMTASGIPRSDVSTYYSRNTVLFCQVLRVENLQSSSPGIAPYVLLETQPSQSQYSRRARTPTKFNAVTADFKDAFIFDGLRPEIQDISVSVWNENTMVKHNRLGHIVIPLEAIFHNMRNLSGTTTGIDCQAKDVEKVARDSTMVFELTQHNGTDTRHKGDGPALIHLSLWFCSAKEAMTACRLLTPTGLPGNVSSAVFFEPELRKVHVDVIKARGLPPKVKKNGSVAGRDSYCTIALTGCAQKNSTQVHRSTLWPDFNERFAFLVAQNQLHRITWGADQGGSGKGSEVVGDEGHLPELAMADCSSEDTARQTGSESHRAEDAAINNQPILEVCKRLGAPILTIKVFDYEPVHQSLGGGDRLIGKLKVPVSHLPMNSAKSCVKPQWIPLMGGSNIRGRKFMTNTPPELCVRACFDEDDRLPGKVRAPIGSVSITLRKVYLESGAADIASERGGLYCVVKYGKELVKTPCHQVKRSKNGVRKKSTSAQQSKRTARDTDRSEYNEYNSIATYRSTPQCTDRSEDHDVFMSDIDSLRMRDLRVFRFGDRCIFAVKEPSSVIAVGIFDVADIKLSKIQMRLSTFLRPSNRMLYPISIEIPDKGESRHVGYLEFSLTINYNSKLDLWRRYFTLTQPPLDYTNPLPLKTQYNVQLQEQDILRGSLLQGSNKLHSDVVKVMLGTETIKFSIPCIQKRFANITESLQNLVPIDLTKIQVYNPATWDKPWLSAVIILAICVAIQFAQYLLPLTFLVLVVAGLCLRKFQREIILYELSRLSKSQEDAEEGSQPGQEKPEDDVQGFMSGLKLDSALVLDDSSVLQQEDEDNLGNFNIPDFESNTFNVDCFWQDTERELGADEESEWEEGEEAEALRHTTGGRSEAKKKKKKLIKVKRRVEIIKLSVEDKLLTIKTKAGTKIKVVKVKMADRVDGVKIKLEDRLKHINAALKSKFPHLRVKLRDLQSANRTLRHNVKHKASKVKTKVGQAVTGVKNRAEFVLSKAGDAIDGVRGRARKEIESSLLAVRRRAGFVVFMDKYIQLKQQYDELKSYSGIAQMMLGDLNKCLQNIRGLVLWTDPRVSFFFVFSLFLLSLFLFCFGFKLTMQLALIYGLRPPFLRDPYPPLALIPFLRMSSVEESPLWCLLGLRSISASNASKNG